MACLGFEPGAANLVGADESTKLWWHPPLSCPLSHLSQHCYYQKLLQRIIFNLLFKDILRPECALFGKSIIQGTF